MNSKFGLRFFRTHMSARLMVIFILVALIPLTVVALLSYQRAYTSLINLALSKMEQDTLSIMKDTSIYIEHFASDLLFISGTSPVQGIIRARDNGGTDPVQKVPYEVWVNKLTHLFAVMARNKHFYQQFRYINENGDEMVRVDYRNNKIHLISGTDQLQNKAQSPYFIASQTLRQGEIYISPINLNRENGNIEVPHVPVIRFSTPIYDNIGKFRGIIVSNIYVANFLTRLTVNLGQIYLTNKEGFYLYHPDPSRTFGFELGTHYNIRHDFPASLKMLELSGSDSYVTVDKTLNEVVSLQKIHFDPRNPQHDWILIRTIPEDEALGAVNGLRLLMLGLALIITIIVIFLARGLANSFTRPIIRLQTVTRQISQTHLPQLVNALERLAKGDLTAKLDLPAHTLEVMSTDDEVGQLTCAFNEMSSNLSESGVVFEQMIANLRQVIEDIVQVSQGLAVGHLRVTPKAEYRGDFVQIKIALETALSDLWQVIEDIVQVSQGLAEGRQHVTAKAEYRGDFVQIKNALETAATKLAEATRKNALQDWIKTGQTQLNEQMSGEQDIMTLAQNIITFLTTYLDAQIGVFYLLEEGEKEHKGNLSKSSRLKLVASYAYIQHEGMANEFKLGEGLVGQAALEKQKILVAEVPKDYIYIQSGLGGAVPQNILVMPFLYENAVKGVIEIGSFYEITEVQLEFLEQVMPNIGIAMNTADSRTKMQALLLSDQ